LLRPDIDVTVDVAFDLVRKRGRPIARRITLIDKMGG
jgi:hypothetical protein